MGSLNQLKYEKPIEKQCFRRFMGSLNHLKYEKQKENHCFQRFMKSLNQLKYEKQMENHCFYRFMGSLNQLKCEKSVENHCFYKVYNRFDLLEILLKSYSSASQSCILALTSDYILFQRQRKKLKFLSFLKSRPHSLIKTQLLIKVCRCS